MQQVSARAKTLQGSGGSAQQVTIGISTMCLCQRSRVRRQHQRSPTRPHWQKINPVLVAAPHVASFQPVREFPKSSSHLCSARRSLLVDLSDLVRQLVGLFHRFAKRTRRKLAWHIICLFARLRVVRSRRRSPSDEALQLVVEFFGENV